MFASKIIWGKTTSVLKNSSSTKTQSVTEIKTNKATTKQASAPSSFKIRKLKVQITLNKGTFKNGSNSIIISDLGMSANIEKLGPPDFGKASVEIYNLPRDVMERISTLAMMPMYHNYNYINIYAGDDYSGYTQVFAGTIASAVADFNSQPDIKMKIDARIGFFGSITAQGQNVVKGTQSVASFVEKQAEIAGFTFKNEGVTASVKNAIFSGSPIEQARQACEQVGAELVIDDDKMILISNGSSVKGTVPKLTASTGLIGYPSMSSNGISFKAVFNPQLKFAGLVELKTLVPKCTGQWRITKLSHKLSSNLPGDGSWESTITAYYPHMSGACGRYV